MSSISWAFNQNIVGIVDGSWNKARTTYYEALTSITKIKKEREERIAYAFQSLGQVMHLVSDTSVPAHVRDDIHALPDYLGGYTYESWAKAKGLANQSLFAGKKVDPSIFAQAVYDTALAAMTLTELDAAKDSRNTALGYLKSRQFGNGSWNESPYQTALAVEAMYKATVDPDLAIVDVDVAIVENDILRLLSLLSMKVSSFISRERKRSQ